MHPERAKRLKNVVLMVGGVALALGLILFALSENINLFYTPSDLKQAQIKPGQNFRVGGMVVKDSVERLDALKVRFKISDFKETLSVAYVGILPDLFKEGTGIVAEGSLGENGVFIAREVLAKHDENYMPPQLRTALQ